MTRPIPGGRRRVDRVLAPDFLDGLVDLPIEQVRERRAEAEQEEVDLSFLRRMLLGRIGLVEAEKAARDSGTEHADRNSVIEALSVDDEQPDAAHVRHRSTEPTRVSEHRRAVERALADAHLSDVGHRTDDELASSLDYLRAYEAEVRAVRGEVQVVVSALTAEIARRYRDGLASVDSLLHPDL